MGILKETQSIKNNNCKEAKSKLEDLMNRLKQPQILFTKFELNANGEKKNSFLEIPIQCDKNGKYLLIGVITELNGFYRASIRKEGSWKYINDEICFEINEREPFKLFSMLEKNKENMVFLAYEKEEKPWDECKNCFRKIKKEEINSPFCNFCKDNRYSMKEPLTGNWRCNCKVPKSALDIKCYKCNMVQP